MIANEEDKIKVSFEEFKYFLNEIIGKYPESYLIEKLKN